MPLFTESVYDVLLHCRNGGHRYRVLLLLLCCAWALPLHCCEALPVVHVTSCVASGTHTLVLTSVLSVARKGRCVSYLSQQLHYLFGLTIALDFVYHLLAMAHFTKYSSNGVGVPAVYESGKGWLLHIHVLSVHVCVISLCVVRVLQYSVLLLAFACSHCCSSLHTDGRSPIRICNFEVLS